MIMAPIRAVLVAVVTTQMAAPGFNVDWAWSFQLTALPRSGRRFVGGAVVLGRR
jgi:hypothetical protein